MMDKILDCCVRWFYKLRQLQRDFRETTHGIVMVRNQKMSVLEREEGGGGVLCKGSRERKWGTTHGIVKVKKPENEYLIVINKIISTNRKIIFGRYEMELNQTKMGLSQFLKLCARRENGDQDEAWFRITVILT